jgi:short subunit dehydrogenase-like uncharacterized protein
VIPVSHTDQTQELLVCGATGFAGRLVAEYRTEQYPPSELSVALGGDGPFVVESCVSADWDPGCGATARMLGEAAMCLVRGQIDSPPAGGVLTPASGIGEPLADRLQLAGLTVAVEE